MGMNNYLYGSPWESIVAYSRLVKCRLCAFILGTTSIDEKGNVVRMINHIYKHNKLNAFFEKLLRINSNSKDIVSNRISVTNIGD